MKILNKQKVEEASDIWSNNPKNLHPADSYIGKQGFISGVSYAEKELSELAIEFARYAVKDYQNWLKGDVSSGNVNEDLFKKFIKERNENT